MPFRILGYLILLLITGFPPGNDVLAEPEKPRPLYIIFDASNSMWGELPDKSRKIEAAKTVFSQLNPSMFTGREVALRLYGHRRKSDCEDTELVIPLSASNDVIPKMSAIVANVNPKGKTPISLSLREALNDFSGKAGDILLISDGIETCGVDPCDLVYSWNDKGIDIKVHVIGLGLTDLSRSAMQCIADVSGTQYIDTNNFDELNLAIQSISKDKTPIANTPDPAQQQSGPEFKISAIDKNGNYLPAKGTLSNDNQSHEISSNQRHVISGGEYQITIGVPTASGEVFEPVTQQVNVKASGSTRIVVTLARPPLIRTRFMENDTETRGVITLAYQDGKQVFKLRPGEDYYVMPGRYDFKANLNKDNSQLNASADLIAGDDEDIVFNAIETVRTYFIVIPEGQQNKIRQHQELWQDGEMKYKIHHANGANVQPGTYTLKSESVLTPYEIHNVVIPSVEKQTLTFRAPFGKARLEYKFIEKPSRSGRRCWVYRLDDNGKDIGKSSGVRCNGSEITLAEGNYRVQAWSYLGTFEDTRFMVKNGETTIVNVKQIKPLLND